MHNLYLSCNWIILMSVKQQEAHAYIPRNMATEAARKKATLSSSAQNAVEACFLR
jgi:hypothetical protein